ncbi:hypothetical protein SASC598J21_015910 [Snodgrassella alvi SCGC AB-598-J21]|uniref:Uncharacterized protein n=1 Tax=Snodgrassella alvi SCGC AB-598-J21 TaxID=1385367 RepID=A0A074V9X8_9NEIS|nr:hypothetical protein SASC598J21_015910 [Snodgrassella alvi SCGC AB-598-J21]
MLYYLLFLYSMLYIALISLSSIQCSFIEYPEIKPEELN